MRLWEGWSSGFNGSENWTVLCIKSGCLLQLHVAFQAVCLREIYFGCADI